MVDLYSNHVKSVAASSAAVYLYSDPFPEGFDFVIFHAFAVDRTSAVGTSIQVGIYRNGTYIPIDAVAGSVAANIGMNVAPNFVVHGGDKLYVLFSNATAGDIIELSYSGYQFDLLREKMVYVHEKAGF